MRWRVRNVRGRAQPRGIGRRARLLALCLSLACGDAGGEGESDNSGAASSGESTGGGGSGGTASVAGDSEGDSEGGSEGDSEGGASTSSGSGTTGPAATGTSDTGEECPQGHVICEGGAAHVCDGMGGFESVEVCEALCVEPIGCALCVPGEAKCEGGDAYACAADGAGFELSQPCDPVQGLSCDEARGACVGACALSELGRHNLGCEFFATDSAALQLGEPWVFSVAAVVVNAGDEPANVTVTRGDEVIGEDVAPAGGVAIVELAYVEGLTNAAYNLAEPSVLAPAAAYRVRADQPVAVFQYNPRGYKSGPYFAYSGDGSLLAPTHTWGAEHRVVSRAHWVDGDEDYSGFYAVIARLDDTLVTLEPSASGGVVLAGGGVAADGTGVVTLNAGDVLQVVTDRAGGEPDASDLTGTRILSSRAVQVLGGHKCTNVPHDVSACDHLEDIIPPLTALGQQHVIAAPLIPSGGATPKVEMVRVTATEDATALSYEPAIPGAPELIALAGEFVELGPLNDDFVIDSDAPVLVTQYMLGQSGGGNVGDPAMLVTPPAEQFRDRYELHAETLYDINFITVVAPAGAEVLLDGAPLLPFSPIGASGVAVARTPLQMSPDGRHQLTSAQPFGVNVYGYGQFATYWFAGGQRLESR